MSSKALSYSSQLQLPVRLLLPSCTRHCQGGIVSFVQTRGAKKKFGGSTRDPYRSLKKKLAMAKGQKQAKIPLMSTERKDSMLEYPMNIKSPGTLFATYVPLEKYARAPFFSRARLGQRYTAFRERLVDLYSGALIKVRLRKVEPFKPKELAVKAQQMFVDANKALQEKNKYALRSVTTENAFEALRGEFRSKRFEWKLVEEVEKPRIVASKAVPYNGNDLVAQVVLRMHTKQIMALYNPLGEVFFGDPVVPKTVIDYVVLERPLESPVPSSTPWRIAGKLPAQKKWNEKTETKALPQTSVPT